MTQRRHLNRQLASPPLITKILIVTAAAAAVATLMTTSASGAAAEERATGLERAAQATMHGLENARGKSSEAPGQANRAKGRANQGNKQNDKHGDKVTGRDRARQAIETAMARGNGKGHAWGRGHALDVLSDLNVDNHGQKVRDLVHAYNALRKAQQE